MDTQRKKGGNLVAILTMFALYALAGFVTFLAAPAGDLWKYQLPGGSNVLGMLGGSMNFVAYLILGWPAGKMLQNWGYKTTAILSTGVGTVGVLIQMASGHLDFGTVGSLEIPGAWFVYLFGVLVSGFSMCLINTVVNPMLNTIVGGGNKGNQLNLGGSALNSLSGAIAPVILGGIVGKITKDTQFASIDNVLLSAAIVFFVATVIIAFLPISNPVQRAKDIVYERSPLAFRHCRLGVLAIFLYLGVEIGIQNHMRLWLAPDNASSPLLSYGIDVASAATIAGSTAFMLMILILAGRLVGAAIGGKISSRNMILACAGSGVLLTVAGALLGQFKPELSVTMPLFTSLTSVKMSQIPLAALFFMLTGLSMSVMWGGIFNLATEGLGKYTEQASGMFMVMVFGGAPLPVLQSWVFDKVGPMASFTISVVCFAYIFFFALVGSKNVNKDIKID